MRLAIYALLVLVISTSAHNNSVASRFECTALLKNIVYKCANVNGNFDAVNCTSVFQDVFLEVWEESAQVPTTAPLKEDSNESDESILAFLPCVLVVVGILYFVVCWAGPAMLDVLMRHMDLNDDGLLDSTEWGTFMRARFSLRVTDDNISLLGWFVVPTEYDISTLSGLDYVILGTKTCLLALYITGGSASYEGLLRLVEEVSLKTFPTHQTVFIWFISWAIRAFTTPHVENYLLEGMKYALKCLSWLYGQVCKGCGKIYQFVIWSLEKAKENCLNSANAVAEENQDDIQV